MGLRRLQESAVSRVMEANELKQVGEAKGVYNIVTDLLELEEHLNAMFKQVMEDK